MEIALVKLPPTIQLHADLPIVSDLHLAALSFPTHPMVTWSKAKVQAPMNFFSMRHPLPDCTELMSSKQAIKDENGFGQ